MAKLAAIIPSRDERFLVPTVEDLFLHAKGEFECVVILDSDKWPDNWADVTAKYPNLHTIHNGKSIGMRASINRGVASAISRRAKFIMKTDAHCSFSEGFDEALKSECEPNWVVIPRRGRLDPEKWTATDIHKPDIDYHYLSYPDDPNDFGGPGLNGKVWAERAVERKDILIDEEMSSQGSCWFMHAKYFQQLELMDEEHYGMFWNEMQEIGLKAWLSGGQLMVNKKAKYLHLHKGRTYGRGYKLPESELTKGATFTKRWLFNEAWPKQTLPFKTLIERFWPVPTWPEDWEEKVYGSKGSVVAVATVGQRTDALREAQGERMAAINSDLKPQLQIRFAYYGVGPVYTKDAMDVSQRVRELVKGDSLDIVVNNDTLTPGQNPYRGKKKKLWVAYNFNGGPQQDVIREEKEWLIIGPAQSHWKADGWLKVPEELQDRLKQQLAPSLPLELTLGFAEKYCPYCGRIQKVYADGTFPTHTTTRSAELREVNPVACKGSGKKYQPVPVVQEGKLMTAALNDYLIRKFHISDRRLRAPMPVELRDFNRNDLAKLFAELGFTRGAEIGVAEGRFSEVLLQANPQCELLLLVDPWHRYSENPQNKSVEKHEFSYNETLRRTKDYPCVQIVKDYSMNAARDVNHGSLDWVYIDGQHQFDFCMQDLIEWSKRVRSGGIVSGDDYYELDRKRWGAGPVEAVQAYTKAHGIALWFTCDAPNSYDYFWVRP